MPHPSRLLLTLLALVCTAAGTAARGNPAIATGAQGPSLRYLPLVVGSDRPSPSPSPSPPPVNTESGALWLPFTTTDGGYVHTYGTNVAVDRAGGIHITYTIALSQDGGHRPAYYVYCAARCEQPASWTRARLSDNVLDARLVLDGADHPRVMLFAEVPGQNSTFEYRYAACDSACVDAASWVVTPITQVINYVAYRADATNRYFALDAQGHPGFVFNDTTDHGGHGGTFYEACTQVAAGACSAASNWREATLTDESLWSEPELAYTPDGAPRVLATEINAQASYVKLVYVECTADCAGGAWDYLYDSGAFAGYSLRLDASGRARAVFYTGQAQGALEPLQLYYLWCDSACTSLSNWRSHNLHTHFGNGFNPHLVLDRDYRPRFVYQQGDVGPGYAWCSANCESDQGIWQSRLIESRDALNALNPVEPLIRCTVSTWTSGDRPALALDSAGNPRIGFDTKHQYGGTDLDHPGRTCPISTDIQLARFAFLKQP